MKLNEAFPSKWLASSDLQGKEPTVTIASTEMVDLGDDKKLAMYFRGKDKGMIVNRTNANTIASMYGDETNAWVGRQITLMTIWTDFQGKMVQALRVKPPGLQSGRPASEVPTAPMRTEAPPPKSDEDYGARIEDEVPF